MLFPRCPRHAVTSWVIVGYRLGEDVLTRDCHESRSESAVLVARGSNGSVPVIQQLCHREELLHLSLGVYLLLRNCLDTKLHDSLVS